MKYLLLCLILASCATSRSVKFNDGTNGYRIKCYEPRENCEKVAQKVCPKGHKVRDVYYPDIHTDNYLIMVDMHIECSEPVATNKTETQKL